MQTTQNGIWSGILATGPMTLAMFLLQKKLPETQKSPLPPATLTSQITAKLGIDQRLSTYRREDLTMLAHFGYGAAAGILFAFIQKKIRGGSVPMGLAFGLGVWGTSYLGLTPLLKMRANAYDMPANRNTLMILAHLVWGLSLSTAEKNLRKSGNEMLDGHRKAVSAE